MKQSRRTFLSAATVGAAALLTPSTATARPAVASPSRAAKARVGIIGTGLRGQQHLNLLLRRDDVLVTAIADIDERMLARTAKLLEQHDATPPRIYNDGPHDYRHLLEREELDAVIIATPWRWHTEMAVAAMEAGVYTGLEVAGASDLEECWELVRAHERTGTHLFFLENVCYRRDVMAVANMAYHGLFGRLLHLEGGYQHDLRHVKFNDGKQPYGGGVEFGEKAFHEARWRTRHSVHRNGDLYPTHGLGPVARMANVNRGNRITGLTAMATRAEGLHDYIVNHPRGGADHPNAGVKFKLGDVVTSLLSTSNGEVIVLRHDTNLPRPYSLGFRVQGTRGIWMDLNDSLLLQGLTPDHEWTADARWLGEYDHPSWREHADKAVGAGHGGMDYFLVDDFIRSVRAGTPAPIDVYDAATWMAVTPLSEASIAAGGGLQAFPDFTRGRWMERRAVAPR